MYEVHIHAPVLFTPGAFGVFNVAEDELEHFLNVWLRHPTSITEIRIIRDNDSSRD